MLIGFTGLAGAGKNTVADMVSEQYGFEQYAFAQPIKEACKVIFGWDDRHVHGALKEVIDSHYNVTPRQAMQTLGTEWGRGMVNMNLWSLRCLKVIDEYKSARKPLAITDVRFDNEAHMIRQMGGKIINVTRPVQDCTDVGQHESEKGISPHLIDTTIRNNGSLRDLELKVENLNWPNKRIDLIGLNGGDGLHHEILRSPRTVYKYNETFYRCTDGLYAEYFTGTTWRLSANLSNNRLKELGMKLL